MTAPAPRAATPEPDAGDVAKLVVALRALANELFPFAPTLIKDHYASVAADMLESLAAAVAESRREVVRLQHIYESMLTEADEKDHEIAGLRRDAERYKFVSKSIALFGWDDAKIDAAIDAAKDSVESSSSTPTGKPLGES